MTESVRPAGPDDLARCAELVSAARREVTRSRGGDLLAVLGAGHAAITGAPMPGSPTSGHGLDPGALVDSWASEGPSRVLLVGTFAATTVGLATGHIAGESPTGEHRLGRVDCCYVEPDARQVGVGTALVEELLSWFATRGCTDLDALALPGDRHTKQLYETAGFKARLLILHRRLG
jgi:GNAT superfamily N-acetyltransferase